MLDRGIGVASIYRLMKERLGDVPLARFSDTSAVPYGKMARAEPVARLNAVIAHRAAAFSEARRGIVSRDRRRDGNESRRPESVRRRNRIGGEGEFMKKTLLYRLFKIGKMPAPEASEIQNEGVILFDEGFKGTKTYIDFRAPWRYSNWKRQWFTASIALTHARLLAFQYAGKEIDAPLADARFGELNFSVEADGALLVAFDASLFHDDWSGNLEYRFYTPLAPEFLDKLKKAQGGR